MKTIILFFSVVLVSGCTSAELVSSLDERVEMLFSSGIGDEVAVVYPAEQSAKDATSKTYYGPTEKR